MAHQHARPRTSDRNDPASVLFELWERRRRGEAPVVAGIAAGTPISVEFLHALHAAICSARVVANQIERTIARLDTDLETVSSTRALLEIETTIPPRIKRLLDWLIDDAIRHGD